MGYYLFFESQGRNFYQLPSLESYSGSSWEGFTVSNSSDNSLEHTNDVDFQFNCLAQGGVDGLGTPFLVGYYSEYYAMLNNESPLQIIFDTIVSPISFYACNTVWTYKSIVEDGAFTRAFAEGDSMTVIIKGLDENYEEIANKELHFDLADYRSSNPTEWVVNTDWELIDLTSLGKVSGLSLKIVSTDMYTIFTNTPQYIALDKVKYGREREETTTSTTAVELSLQVYPNPFVDYILVNSPKEETYVLYNPFGQIVMYGILSMGETMVSTSSLPSGIYMMKVGNQAIKLVK